jgi:hypothetical protein
MLEHMTQAAGAASKSAMVPLRKPIIVPRSTPITGKSSGARNNPKS